MKRVNYVCKKYYNQGKIICREEDLSEDNLNLGSQY